ncbi:MAG: NAD(+)/NADH kinase [Candidatus Falkowbacteria bacterium]
MNRKVALFGGSFNPLGTHHINIIKELLPNFDEIVVVLCGPRPDKATTNDIEPAHRAAMADLALKGLPEKVRVDHADLSNNVFTRTHELEKKFSVRGEVWHVVGFDLVQGGSEGRSAIQREWERGEELWEKSNFVVVKRSGYEWNEADLPPRHMVISPDHSGSSTEIRNRVFNHKPVEDLVTPEVAAYIKRYNLYRGIFPQEKAVLELSAPRPFFVINEKNDKAIKIKERIGAKADIKEANIIVVIGGDGTMLRAIRKHWTLRLPFIGVNAGHQGFLLNEDQPEILKNDFVVYQLPLLSVETRNGQGERRETVAFTDAWMERRGGQSAWFELKLDDRLIPKVAGDGLLVATAAGSTGYARHIAGFSLPPYARNLILAGMNIAEPANWKNIVISQDAIIEFRTIGGKKRPVQAFVDGVPLGDTESMRIKRSRVASVELAFLRESDIVAKHTRLNLPYLIA